jgi:hypothetical protein
VPRPGATHELANPLSTTSVELALAQPGMLTCLAAGAAPGGDDLIFLTAWRDQRALGGFAGPQPANAVLPSGYEALMAHHVVQHRPLLSFDSLPPAACDECRWA